MGLKVIGAGFGRTGTLSLKTALEQLGYSPCHHMSEVPKDFSQIDLFLRAANGEKVNWDVVFHGFEAAVDWPATAYYEELANEYPDAKIILGVRDPEAWYESVKTTIFLIPSNFPRWLRKLVPSSNKFIEMIGKTVWENELNGRFEDKEQTIEVFLERIETVKEKIPSERLLVHRATDGWDPLCQFLNVPVPEQNYPWVNEGRQIRKIVQILKLLNWVPAAFFLSGLAFLLYLV